MHQATRSWSIPAQGSPSKTVGRRTHSNYLVSDMMNLLISLERFVGLHVHYNSIDEVDTKDFDLEYWTQKPLACWPKDDAEAKLTATSIATYNFNNYEVPKRYHELDADDKAEVDPCLLSRIRCSYRE
jgi:hypothetical protein